ncbi:MAG: hypothetical protein AAF985_03180, partial [Bacteroidota bacterium]
MSTKNRIYLFIFCLLGVLYLIRIPPMFDEYTMGRFVVWTICTGLGMWLILPRLKAVDFHLLDGVILSFYALNL